MQRTCNLATLLVLALASACGDDVEPAASTGDTTQSSSTEDASTSSDSTVDPTTATTSGTESSTGIDPTSADASSTTSASNTSSSTDSSTGAESSDSGSSTDTGGSANAFGPCEPEDFCGPEELCTALNSPGSPGHGSVCVFQGCVSADDCPAPPPGGNPDIMCQDVFPLGPGATDCWLSCGGGLACPDGMLCVDGILCLWPSEWTCDFDEYDSGASCDCGCGATDPDCADMGVDDCDVCDGPGSCSVEACPGTITPVDNAMCEA